MVFLRGLCDDFNVAATVVIVDDHPVFRATARKLLEDDGFAVVGEAGTGASAIELAHSLAPDVVLLDVVLPDLDGLEVAGRLADSRSKVVLVSSRDPADFGARFRHTSAVGFISKDGLSGDALRELLEPES
jgi:DNA-binding NarL/FixJ family response regulator